MCVCVLCKIGNSSATARVTSSLGLVCGLIKLLVLPLLLSSFAPWHSIPHLGVYKVCVYVYRYLINLSGHTLLWSSLGSSAC